jgi:predicted phosphodiesterase
MNPRIHQWIGWEPMFSQSLEKKRFYDFCWYVRCERKESMMRRSLSIVLALLFFSVPAFAEKWSFAVVADNRSAFASYRNVLEEIQNMTVNPDHAFSPIDFVLAVGDLSPVAKNDEIYRQVFKEKAPPFFPVRGNHENADDVEYLLKKMIPALGKSVKMYDSKSINYYADWKNVRLIVLDQYSRFARSFNNIEMIRWVEDSIASAQNAEHIFVTYHEPYIPDDPETDPFWSMLLKHRDKVKAVFVGHTHVYHWRRIPNDLGGIYLINAGNAGRVSHSDHRQTIVEVSVDGKNLTFRAVQAPNGTSDFKLRDEWRISQAVSGCTRRPALGVENLGLVKNQLPGLAPLLS